MSRKLPKYPFAAKGGTWLVSDEFWSKVEPLIPAPERPTGKSYRRALGGGRKPAETRRILSAILYILRTGTPWRAAPDFLGKVSTLHSRFKMWQRSGFFRTLRQAEFADPELTGMDWKRTEEEEDLPRLTRESSSPVPSQISGELSEREPRISDSRIQTLLLRLHSVTNAPNFWTCLQSLFRESIPSHSIVTFLDYFDYPNTWVPAKMLATTNANMPTEWFEKRWKLDITPSFLRSNPGIKIFRMSDMIADSRELQGTDYFKQFFKPFDWYHTVSLCYWRKTGLGSVIALRRTQKQGDYRPGEIELFKKLYPHIQTVLNRLVPAHKDLSKGLWLEGFERYLPVPILLLGWTFEPVYANCEALERCALWNFGREKARSCHLRSVFRTPEPILQACKELKAQWLIENRETDHDKWPKISMRLEHPEFQGHGTTITLQINKDLIAKPGFFIHFDAAGTDLGSDHATFGRLTTTERDLIGLASRGCTNKDLALGLNKSISTVKNQLASAYRKLGTAGHRKQFGRLLSQDYH